MPDKKLTYKQRNGTTKVGDFLRSIGKGDLLKKVFGSAAEIITGDIKGAVEILLKGSDDLTEEQRDFALKLLESDVRENEEISKRWGFDMNSDSWLSKNIRPLVLAYLVFLTTVYIVLDSSVEGFAVAGHWVDLLTSILLTTIAAYFGGRSYEKTKKL
ncbi:hypothetical protein [Flavivirga sp. 57AJ16]|uniref:hypothetical protein n=1 Tax=Flavivirga sp. 57AJ16 TaxID=3025307 RepID=UPI0023651AFB|nr:hypothetical protein [Flavivirga sp. 57AJ16]MDD7885751.1 hypothetical protein [Flavivirga sp. 57AJ16]